MLTTDAFGNTAHGMSCVKILSNSIHDLSKKSGWAEHDAPEPQQYLVAITDASAPMNDEKAAMRPFHFLRCS